MNWQKIFTFLNKHSPLGTPKIKENVQEDSASHPFKRTVDNEFYELIGRSIAIFQKIVFEIKEHRFSYVQNHFATENPVFLKEIEEKWLELDASQKEEIEVFYEKKQRISSFLRKEIFSQNEGASIEKCLELLKDLHPAEKFTNLGKCLRIAMVIRNEICHAEYIDTTKGLFLRKSIISGNQKKDAFDPSFPKVNVIDKRALKTYISLSESILHICSDIFYSNRIRDAENDLLQHFQALEASLVQARHPQPE